MATEQEICEAIQSRKQIVYTCTGGHHAAGEREGNPHIVYNAKSGRTIVSIWKTGGVQTKPDGVLPGWRSYGLDDIQLLRCDGNFTPQPDFNPERYYETLCRV